MFSADFIRTNARWLAASALLMAGSSFGQTFFISLFSGVIREDFGLSHGDWGWIYAIGTLGSAALMLWAGPFADRMRVRHISVIVLVLFAALCIAMSVNQWAFGLILIIFGLRFCGQGMMVHIAMVGVGRWFAKNRGKAVSYSALGFPAAEATLPFIFVSLMLLLGWRATWVIAAVLCILVLFAIQFLLSQERQPGTEAEDTVTKGMSGRDWTRKQALNHWLFWMVTPAFLMLPIFSTSMIFQQVHLTEVKGWSHTGFVAMFPLLSGGSILASLTAGRVVDRIGVGRLVPYFQIPFIIGYLIIAFGSPLAAAGIGLMFLGVAGGLLNAVNGSFWAVFYGTRNLGAIRSISTSAMVFGSAIGPAITGALIDYGINFDQQMKGIVFIMAATSVLAFVAIQKARPLVTDGA